MSKRLNITHALRRLNLDVRSIHTTTLVGQLLHEGGEGVGVQGLPVGGAGAQGFPCERGITLFIVLYRLLNI